MHVVNVRFSSCTHYIGRQSSYNPDEHGEFVRLGNPYRLTGALSRGEVVNAYEEWARSQPLVLKQIKALPRNAILGCWCKPLACHGDVIIKLWKELNNEP